jgi:hypothetical protein
MRPSHLLTFVVSLSFLESPSVCAAGALDVVAQKAAQALGQVPASSVVVAAPLVSDEPAPRGLELALRMVALIAGKIGARAHAQTAQLGPARAIAGRASALVFVQTEVSRGDLRSTVDVYPSMANAWDRIRNPLPSPFAHAFASAKVDAEVRSFLLPLLLEQPSVHRARLDETDVLAVACGDIDDDGGDEIVLVSRERVAIGRLRDAEFVAERTALWGSLALRTPVPMREPLAGAAFGAGLVAVGSTERGAVSLTPELTVQAPLRGVPAWGGEGVVCLMSEPSAGAFDGAPLDCAIGQDSKPKMAVPAPRFDAFAANTITDAQGNSRPIVALHEPSGKIKLKMGDAPTLAPEGTFGSELAVCDLDQDGLPEIASSADATDDALDIWSWPSQGASLRPRLHLSAPGGVRALAACPPEEHGQPALLAVVGNELWVIRAGVVDRTAKAAKADGIR